MNEILNTKKTKLFFSRDIERDKDGTMTNFGFFQITIGWIFPCLFLFILFMSCFVIIKTSEVGIKSRLGVISDNILLEGFHLKLPFFDNIEKVSIKQHQETSILETQTSDLQPAKVSYQVMYSIPANVVIKNKKQINGDLFDVLIKKRTDESIRDALAKYPAEELIINRGKISQIVKDRLSDRVKEHAEIDDIAILSFDFQNAQWMESVNKKVKAKQDAETAEINKQQAQAEADQIIIKAKADAESIRITANAISNNPKIIELRQVEVNKLMVEKWNGVSPTTVMNSSKDSNIILPLK